MNFSQKILELCRNAERDLAPIFAKIDETSFYNTDKIMDSFRENRVATAMFDSTSGYGYDDRGRDTLDRIWAEVISSPSTAVKGPGDTKRKIEYSVPMYSKSKVKVPTP